MYPYHAIIQPENAAGYWPARADASAEGNGLQVARHRRRPAGECALLSGCAFGSDIMALLETRRDPI